MADNKTIQARIDQETENIRELELKKVPYYPELGRFHEKNTPFELHHIEIRDAYWRRRMLKAELAGFDEAEMTATASVY